jgi:hypothetical protein
MKNEELECLYETRMKNFSRGILNLKKVVKPLVIKTYLYINDDGYKDNLFKIDLIKGCEQVFSF